ncbi:AarF/UbiB family protein [Nibricoccus sp. IMCC34717]|uniref:AarF/UbiB family protein n=1 Tax=Nibricoccus sp. IMCC34717 TaxID=3034021 RepID=UPI00384AF297
MATTRLPTSDPSFEALFEDPGPATAAEFETSLDGAWKQHFRNGPLRAQILSGIEVVGRGASLAQVHRARLNDGRFVAVKQLHRGSHQWVKEDTACLGMLLRPIAVLRKRAGLGAYREEMRQRLEGELDLRREAEWMDRFHQKLREDLTLRVPSPHLAWCTRDFIVMDWMDGEPFHNCLQWSAAERESIGATLVRLFLKGVFEWGFVHADPNPGNYRVVRRPGAAPLVQVFDFGSVYELAPEERDGWNSLKEATIRHAVTPEIALAGFEKLGFKRAALSEFAERLPDLVRLLLRPFSEGTPVRTREWHLSRELQSLLGPHRMAFRSAGPPRFLFFIRAFQGLLHQLDALDARFDNRAQHDPVDGSEPVSPPLGTEPEAADTVKGPDLNLEVTRTGVVTARITLPNHSIDALEELIPVDIREKLRAEGTDLKSVVAAARTHREVAGDVVTLGSPDRQVRIWLA